MFCTFCGKNEPYILLTNNTKQVTYIGVCKECINAIFNRPELKMLMMMKPELKKIITKILDIVNN